MTTRILASVLVAALVALAGCGGAAPGDGTPATDIAPTTAPDGAETPAPTADASGSDGGSGAVRFYVSDERNAIGDFRHLNVTVSKIGLKPARDETGGTADETESARDGSPTPTPTPTATPTATPTPDGNDSETSASLAALAAADGATSIATASVESAGKGGWIEYDVDSRTYDLTELQGARASHLADADVPAGSYEKVFVYVSSLEGTLADGTAVNVKLPSEKLHLNKGFAVGDGESIDFVYDVTVREAGKSGKYVLKPVVGESGTGDEINIEAVDGDDADDGTALSAAFVGEVTPGNDAVVETAVNGSALANATVSIDGAFVGETDETGRVTVSVPENATAFEVRVSYGDETARLSREFESKQSGRDANEAERGNGKAEGGKNR